MKEVVPSPQDSKRITLRAARPADQAALLLLIRAYYCFDQIRYVRRAIDAALTRLLRSRSLGRVWIMHDAAKAIGYIALTFNYDLEFGGVEGLVTDLFVATQYRGRGLGRRALEVVDDYCRRNHITTVELQVERDNVAAQAFYRKLGFQQLTRVVMTRKVSPRQS